MKSIKVGHAGRSERKREPRRNTGRSDKYRRAEKDPKDFRMATSLTQWLRVKHGLTYKQFRNKSTQARYALRAEYTEDTGREIQDGGDTVSRRLNNALDGPV